MSIKIPQLHLDPDVALALSKAWGAGLLWISVAGYFTLYRVYAVFCLNAWIISKHTPAPNTSEHEGPESKAPILKLLSLTSFGGICLYLLGELAGGFAWNLLVPLSWILTLVYLIRSGSPNHVMEVVFSAHRTKDGNAIVVSTRRAFWATVFVLVSLTISVHALRSPNGSNIGGVEVLSILGCSVIFYHLCAGRLSSNRPRLFSFLVHQYFISLPIILIALSRSQDLKSGPRRLLETIDQIQKFALGNFVIRAAIIPLSAIHVVQFLAMILRFDYMLFTENEPEALLSTPVIVEVVPLSSLDVVRTCKAVGDGVKLPNEVPYKFSRRYYDAAFRAWFLTVLGFCSTPFLSPNVNEFTALVAAMCTAPFSAATVTLLLAVYNGESRKLWKYSEDWKSAPLAVADDEA